MGSDTRDSAEILEDARKEAKKARTWWRLPQVLFLATAALAATRWFCE